MKKDIFKKSMVALLIFAGYAFVSAQGGDASLELKPSVSEVPKGDEFTVDVVLKNPGQQSVISVRSWLTYDSSALEAVNIDSSASDFTLSAPGEDTISHGEGRVKIGRSNITGGVSKAESKVVIVRFKVLAEHEKDTTIGFYDYQVSELGHTSVNIIDQGFPANILSRAPDSIQVKLNPGVGAAPAPTPPPAPAPTPAPTPAPQPEIGGGALNFDLIRPTNLRVNTGSGYVDLVWEAFQDPARVGYNIYYGKQSGQYTRRRSIGNAGSYRLDGLNNNETYFFAVTAYDQLNRESDYSNEVGVIINAPLSSTHPFASLIQQAVAAIPFQPQNGPLVGWLIFSAAGLSGALVYGRRKRRIPITNINQ